MNRSQIIGLKLQAEHELKCEAHREAVEKYKVYLRTKRSLWVRLFPWRITITRRDKFNV
jgi:hypothetical protein